MIKNVTMKNKTKYYFLGIPFLKIKKFGNTKLKIYFCGIPVYRISFIKDIISVYLFGIRLFKVNNIKYMMYMDYLEDQEKDIFAASFDVYETRKNCSYEMGAK